MQIVCVLATTAFLFSTTLGQSTRENPNLKFLDTQYFDEYSNRPNSAFPGGSPQFDSNNNANNPNGVLTDDAQNALNYQRIQAAYALNPDPTAGQIFTNNIYGYNYAINNQPPTFNGNATLYLPPEQRNNRRKRNIIELRERSRNLRKKRQAITGSDTFQGTAYANQGLLFNDNDANLGNFRLYDPANTAPSTTRSPQETNAIISNNERLLRDEQNSNCSGRDPGFCESYAQTTYNGYITYERLSQTNACTKLKDSLKNSISSCCNAVRGVGCT